MTLQITEGFSSFVDFFLSYQYLLLPAIIALIVVVGAVVAERLVRRAVKKYSQRMDLDEHVENLLKLVSRIIIYLVALFLIFPLFGVDLTALVAVSTFSGAAIGFASTQTLGNFLAGVYTIVTRPFLVGDYVAIGGNEGLVKEITINYTRLHTTAHNILRIPNREVLNSRITVYSKGEQVDYTFTISFDHSVGHGELAAMVLAPSIEEFQERHREKLTAELQFFMTGSNRLEKTYGIRLFFHEDYTVEFWLHTGTEVQREQYECPHVKALRPPVGAPRGHHGEMARPQGLTSPLDVGEETVPLGAREWS
ncbi:MAG: mechanosensitive ion channel family protein [Candidatus Geothermarchaeales archaeon]